MREDLPPITHVPQSAAGADRSTLQNTLFDVFEELLEARKIEGAIASGSYDLGVETLTAESLVVAERRTRLHASADRRGDARVQGPPA